MAGKGDALAAFDELYNMPEQSMLREECNNLVGKSNCPYYERNVSPTVHATRGM